MKSSSLDGIKRTFVHTTDLFMAKCKSQATSQLFYMKASKHPSLSAHHQIYKKF